MRCLVFPEIAGKNEILGKAIVEIRDDNDEDIGAKTINIGKTRGSSQHRRISKDREIKMHPFSRGIVSMSAKSPAIIAEFTADRYPFSSPEDRDRLSEADRMRKEREKKHERWREEEGENRLEIDKEDGVARRGEEQKNDSNGYPQGRHLGTVDGRAGREWVGGRDRV